MRVLVTGGAGFIGTRLAKRLAASGASVTVLDNLNSQIHGAQADFTADLRASARCVRGDVRDMELVRRVLAGQEVVVHLAAETGTGQSMYALRRYEEVNVQGTAVLLEALVNDPARSVQKLVVASSRAIYGEGQYRCPEHGTIYPPPRSAASLAAGRFDPRCLTCDRVLEVLPTSEDAPACPTSFYGLTKHVQEQMVLMFASALGLSGVALRYQNVFGPGQSLRNPYTGILAVFSNLARQNKALQVFEDGRESRDFIYVDDAVEATARCLEPEVQGVRALNIGAGQRVSVLAVAQAIAEHCGPAVPICISGDYRLGDVRHSLADVSAFQGLTGFQPRWSFAAGLAAFLRWAAEREIPDAGFERSLRELRARGLLLSSRATPREHRGAGAGERWRTQPHSGHAARGDVGEDARRVRKHAELLQEPERIEASAQLDDASARDLEPGNAGHA